QLEIGFDNYSTLPLELALVDCAQPSVEERESPTTQPEYQPPPPVKEVSPPKKQPAKPKAEPPKAENIPTTPPELHSEIERLRLNWRQVIEQAPESSKRTSAIAILRSAGVKPVTIEGDTVVLAFRYPIHKEKLETAENQQVVTEIISNFLGHPCRVRCIHEPEDNHLVEAAKRIGAQITSVEEK
ncbi:MAG: hypothetical protein KAV68_00355, partial [Dehalococcoidales bacterium]|nr:hypothetical protein [Dehalococcoidales bacterium]